MWDDWHVPGTVWQHSLSVLTHLILTTNIKEVLLLVHFADEGTEAQSSLGKKIKEKSEIGESLGTQVI